MPYKIHCDRLCLSMLNVFEYPIQIYNFLIFLKSTICLFEPCFHVFVSNPDKHTLSTYVFLLTVYQIIKNMSNITDIHKGFSPFHHYSKQTLRFLSCLLLSSREWFHLRMEAGILRNVVFVLHIYDKDKSPC
jgi:hypothetical protein